MTTTQSSAILSLDRSLSRDPIDRDVRGESWEFGVVVPDATRVFLVHETAGRGSTSTWLEMRPSTDTADMWTLNANLPPGLHRFRYYAEFDGAVLNCGTDGLTGRRRSAFDPAVVVEPDFDKGA